MVIVSCTPQNPTLRERKASMLDASGGSTWDFRKDLLGSRLLFQRLGGLQAALGVEKG